MALGLDLPGSSCWPPPPLRIPLSAPLPRLLSFSLLPSSLKPCWSPPRALLCPECAAGEAALGQWSLLSTLSLLPALGQLRAGAPSPAPCPPQ